MEGILEALLTILFSPFAVKYNSVHRKINTLRNKTVRILLKILILLLPMITIFGIISLVSYLIRGYWV